MAAALMAGDGTRRNMERVAARLIKPNDRLSSLERFEIYRQSYWCRLIDSLRDDFQGLCAILGDAAFDRMARAYLADCPSRSFTLRDLGSGLARWLTKHKKYAGWQFALALDIVRLEWAHVVAFDGPEEKALSAEDLSAFSPDMRLGLQPYVSLLELRYPVDELRRAKKRRVKAEKIFVAVHRVDLQVYYRRLQLEEFRLLAALRDGHSVRRAIEKSAVSGEDGARLLEKWFAAWAQFGWLTAKRK